ncbi:L,D-transpeptidase [Humibacillus xanthopallidus]|uniref:Lipoprotein-anchoring transpeptidase ErfK/SrfK n=1 Tax=Humibacillus xanthopallidus TaxID=412689 RepID=A0A543HVR3_9MICO|nr:Ig-like domain-containing protein [Humibacillus xanthopallidus]TQM62448.1 lipoprotein-anchoring transpeptidase ErfK/SrfK [Humibacillus xanthopallidus]
MKLTIRHTVVSSMALVAVLAVSACNASANADGGASAATGAGGSQTSSAGGQPSAQTPTVDPVTWKTTPQDKATNVAVDTRVTASADKGTLEKASLSYVSKKGNTVKVDGTLENGTWTAGDLLEPGVKYTLALEAKTTDGATIEETRTFRTDNLTLDQQVYVAVSPRDGGTVGIGMPVIVRFDLPVVDKANFEKNMHVTTTPAQAGSWYWLSSKEAHWRPATYWKPGTKVKVDAQLNGVPAGGGRWGEMSRTSEFTIGRSVIAKVDLKKHQMKVVINGKVAKTIPVTGGQPGFITRSGVKVIMDKVTNITMRAETIGLKKGDPGYYSDTPVKWALRLTNSGEFLHSAPWSVKDQGVRNVSHGCTGMSDSNAEWVYKNMIIGDVVETTGTDRPMTMGNGYADWNLSPAKWAAGSAL